MKTWIAENPRPLARHVPFVEAAHAFAAMPFAGSIERPGTTASPDELVRVAKEFGLEDMVAKRKDSVYESGKRTGAWIKYRVNRGKQLSPKKFRSP